MTRRTEHERLAARLVSLSGLVERMSEAMVPTPIPITTDEVTAAEVRLQGARLELEAAEENLRQAREHAAIANEDVAVDADSEIDFSAVGNIYRELKSRHPDWADDQITAVMLKKARERGLDVSGS